MNKIQLTILISSIISFVLCLVNSSELYGSLFLVILYPLVYAFGALGLSSMLIGGRRGCRITVSVFLFLQWIRNVLIPAIATTSGYYSYISDVANDSTALKSSFLCLYELIITFLFCYVLLKSFRNHKNVEIITYSLFGNKYIYSVYVLIAFILFILFGSDMYTFLKLSTNVTSRASLLRANLVLQAVIEYGMTCLMILILYHCYVQHNKTGNKKYIWFALIASMLRICIISSESESRMAVLYSVGVFVLLLPKLFPNYKKRILINIFFVSFIVIGLLTIYKTFRAFLYGSYIEAVFSGDTTTDLTFIAYTLDNYFYTVKDVARNLFISENAGLTYNNLIADFVLNIFCLKYLIPFSENTTIGAYNYYIYGGERISGHLYSAIAYGYSYLSMIIAPLSTCINIFLVAYLESLLNRFKSLDVLYVNSLLMVRCAATMFACLPFALNYFTRTLIISIIVVGGSSLFKKKIKIMSSSSKRFNNVRSNVLSSRKENQID